MFILKVWGSIKGETHALTTVCRQQAGVGSLNVMFSGVTLYCTNKKNKFIQINEENFQCYVDNYQTKRLYI